MSGKKQLYTGLELIDLLEESPEGVLVEWLYNGYYTVSIMSNYVRKGERVLLYRFHTYFEGQREWKNHGLFYGIIPSSEGRYQVKYFLWRVGAGLGEVGYKNASEPIARVLTGDVKREFVAHYKANEERALVAYGLGKQSFGSTGTDPEVFALDEAGRVIPAFNWLPSKEEAKDGIFWDGFQAEFNPSAAYCHESLQNSIIQKLRLLKTALNGVDPRAHLWAKSVVDVNPITLKTLPTEFVRLGCMASLNAYEDEKPLVSEDAMWLPYRTAGCHIHFGIGRSYDGLVPRIVKHLDAILGVVMTSLFRDLEDPRRRKMYGRAGEYRLPEHGLEYRVPAAETIAHPVVYMLCFDLARQAMAMGVLHPSLWQIDESRVRTIINDSDWKEAEKVLKEKRPLLRGLVTGLYSSETVKKFETLVLTGARNWLPMDQPLDENWLLNKAQSLGQKPEGGWAMHSSVLEERGERVYAQAQAMSPGA